jgi:hypothetical protein
MTVGRRASTRVTRWLPDLGLPIPSVNRVRSRKFGHRRAMNPNESSRYATGGVAEEDAANAPGAFAPVWGTLIACASNAAYCNS